MKIADLIFVGIKGSIVALHRATGEQVWVTRLKASEFVNVVLQEEALIASCGGEIFRLDPLLGNVRWHNPLKSFGLGLVTIAPGVNPGSAPMSVLAEKHHREETAAASAAAVSTAG